jgi:alkanesulfonate monooxygenase SsuD/methylene tetrahydromethanopterin reductase-like flavin-dependent oxidoreductase (luciferase family)
MALEAMKANAFVGSAQTVAAKLRAMAEKLELDELAIITWTYDPKAQARSYELLAQEFNLTA